VGSNISAEHPTKPRSSFKSLVRIRGEAIVCCWFQGPWLSSARRRETATFSFGRILEII
jgi:hypothetical protein